ncbi:PREDICTED: cell adhesion molecule 3-like, partial [Lepidothrix coronata]|uniref:Cell adhesion molecule 3-like n=1 Tax=Lepidothrix coronata TaxID=321398 RepID=A0A6J0G753_9PASS
MTPMTSPWCPLSSEGPLSPALVTPLGDGPDTGVEVLEDPNGKTFTVSSRVEFRVTKEENGAEVTCSVDHESLQNSERSTTEKLQVH